MEGTPTQSLLRDAANIVVLAAGMANLLVSSEYGKCVSSGNGRAVSSKYGRWVSSANGRLAS